ncbi:MAG: FHA domain-containing protein, partial [Planctomycetes bacterium]|nr:FHA domain-containing protein [Planctomycetota bacterium]
MQTVETATLHISGKGADYEMPLDPSGVILGRTATCQIVLDSPKISREHARVYQDP